MSLNKPSEDKAVRKAASGYNLIRGAGDHSEQVLIWAAYNAKLTHSVWCRCEDQSDVAYFRDPKSGDHGWACFACHGIVQTG